MEIRGIAPGDGAVRAIPLSRADGTGDARPSSPGVPEQTPGLANRLIGVDRTSLEIIRHPATGMMIMRVIDRNTGEVVIEAPPEKVLDSVSYLLMRAGLLFDHSA